MLDRILVPLDGSELAEAALPVVEELAAKLSAEVVLLQAVTASTQAVSETVPGGGFTDPGLGIEVAAQRVKAETDAAERYLTSTKSRLETKGLQVRLSVVEGTAASAILDCAQEQDVSLIAIATHGRSGLARTIMGSVADSVVRSSLVPVLVVRPRS